MASYGLTRYGFIQKSADQIRQSYESNLQAEFPGIDTSSDAVGGQIIGVMEKTDLDLWDAMSGIYSASYLDSAEGVALDDIGELVNIKRAGAKSAEAIVSLKGIESTLIDTNTIVATTQTNIEFKNKRDVTISVNSSILIDITVSDIQDSQTYFVKINEINVEITSGASATAISIADALAAKINLETATLGVNAELPSTPDGSFKVISNDLRTSFTPEVDSKLTLTDFWTPAEFISIETGDIEAPTGSITVIVTTVAGLSEVYNFDDAISGSDIENDAEYRNRIKLEIKALGGGNLEAIVARMFEVEDVTAVKGFENVSILTDGEGRPPKSIEILIIGGADADIANKLWYVKGGGIETYGSTSVIVDDSQGEPQTIKFSRPDETYIWIRVALTLSGTGDEFQSDGIPTKENNLLLVGRTFGIGDDIIIQRFYCPVYSVSGIESAVVELSQTATPTGPPVTWVTTNISIDDTEIGLFDSARIEVTIP